MRQSGEACDLVVAPRPLLGLPWHAPCPLRSAIAALHRADEAACVQGLLADGRLRATEAAEAERGALALITALRRQRPGLTTALMREYDLSNPEGIRLMGLAEALLRIPDAATADALIRDKLRGGDWRAHLGQGRPALNAATRGLDLASRMLGGSPATGLLPRLRDATVRRAMRQAIGRMGDIFVCGQTIGTALDRARALERSGFRFSFDMLGEAAVTAEDAARYDTAYHAAIAAIGQASAGRGLYEGPGISIKLSALHPRYGLHQKERVMRELLPRVTKLFLAARTQGIGITIDAEESERLDLSLDLLEALCHDPGLAGWQGIGFVVQAYQKRAPAVLDWIIDLATRTGRRIMLRLVKGAYWDSEIKRSQIEGQADYPVYTRKAHTDLAYLACARKLLAGRQAIFPQFATHNAQTLAAIAAMAGSDPAPDRLEFQCLYGMGEPLYRTAFSLGLARSCRIYAPVGTHETLLAYLVRRLLENGANASFVHRLADHRVPVAELLREPAEAVAAEAAPGSPHPAIPRPGALYGTERANARGLDLFDGQVLQALDSEMRAGTSPRLAPAPGGAAGPALAVRNPACTEEIVGHVIPADARAIEHAVARAEAAAAAWGATLPSTRAAILRDAADRFEAAMPRLIPLIIREAGKTVPNAIGDVREAVDFLRYYAAEIVKPGNAGLPLGPFACISPWNFPLSIFTGQVAAALAAGNTVLAKPAEETPLTALAAVTLLHAAGIGDAVLQLVPGAGEAGAALVGDHRVRGVAFTGSTAVAKRIEAVLALRLNPDGQPVPLIAETGGLNAMVVDFSALPEQVVADVITSAFDSAGQRCSALRLLCVQTDMADRLLPMLEGAMAELTIGDPSSLATDIGPVISEEARERIEAHVTIMQTAGYKTVRSAMPPGLHGFFVPPTLISLRAAEDLHEEIFGPILHVLTYDRADLPKVIDAVNARGYALTAGVQSRIDATAESAAQRFNAGNIYVNRSMIGATVGVQPFGGHGLSGTGPKAGGPLYLRRFMAAPPALAALGERRLPGPAGERNLYGTRARHALLCVADDETARRRQIEAVLRRGAWAIVDGPTVPAGLPRDARIAIRGTGAAPTPEAALFCGPPERLSALLHSLAESEAMIVPVFQAAPDGGYPPEAFVTEYAIATNTAATGGTVELLAAAEG